MWKTAKGQSVFAWVFVQEQESVAGARWGERCGLREASARIGSRPARVSGGESGLDGWRHGGLRLGRSRGFQERVLLSLDLPESVPQFVAERLGDIQQDAAVFGQREQAEPLAIINGHHFQGG